MSYVLTAIISMIFGAGIMACFKVSGGCSEQERVEAKVRDAYEKGNDEGYGDGYDVGYRAGIKWRTALKNNRQSPVELVGDKITIDSNSLRVDVAPGPDSIRPEGKAHD